MNVRAPLRATVVLSVFAIIATAILAFTYEKTRGPIADAEQQALLRNLDSLIPASRHDNDLLKDTVTLPPEPLLGTNKPTTAYRARQGSRLTAVAFTAVAPDGYNGDIRLLLAVNPAGTLLGVRVISEQETPGLGDNIELDRSNWILMFDGKSLQNPEPQEWKVKKDGGRFDQLTGATITPRAVVKAVRKALMFFAANRATLLETSAANQGKPL
jgi:electron transport complex protein RnfG